MSKPCHVALNYPHEHEKFYKFAWCGKKLYCYDWYFLDVTHVANAGRNGSGIQVCKECCEEIVGSIENCL